MSNLDVIFAVVVGVLAGVAAIGALVFAMVWEWCAIKKTLAAHRRQSPETFWRHLATVSVGERRP